jgi:hypothetical protein
MNYARRQIVMCQSLFPAGCGVELNIINLCYIDENLGFDDDDDSSSSNLLLSHITEFRHVSANTKCTPLYVS